MAGKTKIEWTDFSSNPIRFRRRDNGKVGHACVKVSSACTHCYAERMNKWVGTGLDFTVLNMELVEPFLDEKELRWISRSKKISGKRVFIEDMSDLFGEWVPFEWIDRIFGVMALRSDVTFQVLTKRADRMLEYFQRENELAFPLENVWLGVTAENQKEANKRVPILQRVPAAVRFLSCEPLLDYIDLSHAVEPDDDAWHEVNADWDDDDEPEEFVEECEAECDWVNYGNDLVANPEYREWEQRRRTRAGFKTLKHGAIDLIIAGGESGPDARITLPIWLRALRDECMAAGIDFFFKQWGEHAPVDQLSWVTDQTTFKHKPVQVDGAVMVHVGKALAGRVLDGRTWDELPTDLVTESRTGNGQGADG